MTTQTRTEQEDFWAGAFGNAYLERNAMTAKAVADRLSLWASILRHCAEPITSVLELGARQCFSWR